MVGNILEESTPFGRVWRFRIQDSIDHPDCQRRWFSAHRLGQESLIFAGPRFHCMNERPRRTEVDFLQPLHCAKHHRHALHGVVMSTHFIAQTIQLLPSAGVRIFAIEIPFGQGIEVHSDVIHCSWHNASTDPRRVRSVPGKRVAGRCCAGDGLDSVHLVVTAHRQQQNCVRALVLHVLEHDAQVVAPATGPTTRERPPATYASATMGAKRRQTTARASPR
jgi:hypothetical protein